MSESYRFALLVKRGAAKLDAVPPHLRTRVGRLAKDLSESDLQQGITSEGLKNPERTGHPGAIRRARSV